MLEGTENEAVTVTKTVSRAARSVVFSVSSDIEGESSYQFTNVGDGI